VTIIYRLEPELEVDEFIDVLRRSQLAGRRPIDERERLDEMLRQADVTIAARTPEGLLIGISRAISDFSFSTFLIDLAVDQAYQGQGIGRCLIARTHEEAGYRTSLVLHAAPAAATYYPHVGMQTYDDCWYIPRTD